MANIVYRTDDLSQWGYGQGSDLSAVQIDNNFWNLNSRVSTLEISSAHGKSIAEIFESNGALWVLYTDHTTDGPFPIPTSAFRWRGVWAPTTAYSVNDLLYYQGGIYFALQSFTSGSSFALGGGGSGGQWLQLMLLFPAIPTATVSTATFQPDITYSNTYIRCTNATGCAFTIPNDATVTWVVDTEMHVRDCTQSGGWVSFIAGSGVTINFPEGRLLRSLTPGAVIGMKHVAANTWDLWGLLEFA
jgi:hypothetical protein